MFEQPAVSSHSLGRAWVHQITSKLQAAQENGLNIELFYEDLEYLARSLTSNTNDDSLLRAAEELRGLCDNAGVNVICLQPFMHYEGLRDRAKHAFRIEQMKLWTRLAIILGTDLISIPSSFLPEDEASGDFELIVSDFRELAELNPSIKFCYESLCWGTYVDTWEEAWRVVQAVNRDNFGLCLDTFNLAGKIFADPRNPSGRRYQAEHNLEQSLDRLRAIDVTKLFFLQIVDAEKLEEPLTPSHELYHPGQPSRMSWSRNCRLFYDESDRGAYLPIKLILDVIVKELGYTGPSSAEVFHACLTDPAEETPYQLAERAAVSFEKLQHDFENMDRGCESQNASAIRQTGRL